MRDSFNEVKEGTKDKQANDAWANIAIENQAASPEHTGARNKSNSGENTEQRSMQINTLFSRRDEIEAALPLEQKLELENSRLSLSSKIVKQDAQRTEIIKKDIAAISPELGKVSAEIGAALSGADKEFSEESKRNEAWYHRYDDLVEAAESCGSKLQFTTKKSEPQRIALIAMKSYEQQPPTVVEFNDSIPLQKQIKELNDKDVDAHLAARTAQKLGWTTDYIRFDEAGAKLTLFAPVNDKNKQFIEVPLGEKTSKQLLEIAEERVQQIKNDLNPNASTNAEETYPALYRNVLNERYKLEGELSDEQQQLLNSYRLYYAEHFNHDDFLGGQLVESFSPELAEKSQTLRLIEALHSDALAGSGLLEESRQWLNPYEKLEDSSETQVVKRRAYETGESQIRERAAILTGRKGDEQVVEIKLDSKQSTDKQLEEIQHSLQDLSGAREVSNAYGLSLDGIEHADNAYQLKLSYNLDYKKRHEFKVDLNNLESALNAEVLKKEAQLEEKYGIEFAQPGQIYIRVLAPPLHARIPSLPELSGLEKALELSSTALPSPQEPKLKLFFSMERSPTAVAQFSPPRQNQAQPVIIKYPSSFSLDTAADAKEINIHELAHLSQSRAWGDIYSVPLKIATTMGWKYADHSLINGSKWKLSGNDGKDYCYLNEMKKWKDCKAMEIREGHSEYSEIDAAINQAQSFSSREIMKKAAITPASDYFDNPIEMNAELLTNYRKGEQSRAALISANNGLYELAKEQDQEEINRRYPRVNSEPSMLRLPNGKLAKNTTEIRATINEFERTNRMKVKK